MEALDVEQGSYSNSNSFAQRASALFASLGLTRRHRFEQLPQDEVEEIQKVVQAAGAFWEVSLSQLVGAKLGNAAKVP